MLQTVISAMSMFAMMCLDIPKKVLKILEQKMRIKMDQMKKRKIL